MTSTKALQRISEIFGQPVIPLCVPDGNGGCRVVGAGHGPDCLHPGKRPLFKGWQSPDWKLSPEALEQYARMGANWGLRLGDILAVVPRARSQADSHQTEKLKIKASHRQEMSLMWRQSRGNSKKE